MNMGLKNNGSESINILSVPDQIFNPSLTKIV